MGRWSRRGRVRAVRVQQAEGLEVVIRRLRRGRRARGAAAVLRRLRRPAVACEHGPNLPRERDPRQLCRLRGGNRRGCVVLRAFAAGQRGPDLLFARSEGYRFWELFYQV